MGEGSKESLETSIVNTRSFQVDQVTCLLYAFKCCIFSQLPAYTLHKNIIIQTYLKLLHKIFRGKIKLIGPTLSCCGQAPAGISDHFHPTTDVFSAEICKLSTHKLEQNKLSSDVIKKHRKESSIESPEESECMWITCGNLGIVGSLVSMTKPSRSSSLSFLLVNITYRLAVAQKKLQLEVERFCFLNHVTMMMLSSQYAHTKAFLLFKFFSS